MTFAPNAGGGCWPSIRGFGPEWTTSCADVTTHARGYGAWLLCTFAALPP